jgi:predicted DNA-binding transcriptional regulator YafY
MLEEAFGIVAEPAMEVKVRFSPRMAHAIKDRIWHASQQVTEEPDGSLLLSFRAGGRMEILSWLLSYGPHAELLSPLDLREELARMVRETAGMYGDQKL